MMFNLHTLGWYNFQRLCLTIMSEVLGQTLSSFLSSHDGGRDGAFEGIWKPAKNAPQLEGKFVIQCKFTSKQGKGLQLSDIKDETEKAVRLVQNKRCDIYVLMTNAGVSGALHEKLCDLLIRAGVKHPLILGETWIVDQILKNKILRLYVPRVYGLGDLSQILDERAYAQGKALLESMRDDLKKFVITDAYNKAACALAEYNYVLLIGEPAAGKTTIASALAMAAADNWQLSVMKLDHPQDMEHWNPDEPSQFFWIDDAFGVTQYQSHLADRWNRVLSKMKTMLSRGGKIVMTSRDYIYNSAISALKSGAFPLFRQSQVIVNVQALTARERREILYNHLRMGTQPQCFLAVVKKHLEKVADHPRFIPEIARRLAAPFFTKSVTIYEKELLDFVEKRESVLVEILQGLDADSSAALALIYMRNGQLTGLSKLTGTESDALMRLQSDWGRCLRALQALEGSLVIRVDENHHDIWKFKHPTIGDAYAQLLGNNRELLDIFIQGSSAVKLMEQVTCGDMGIKNAVILPALLFKPVAEKITFAQVYAESGFSRYEALAKIYQFLIERCASEFLVLYIQMNPAILHNISLLVLPLYRSKEVNLAARLDKFGILPGFFREKIVERIMELAGRGQDLDIFLYDQPRGLLTSGEIERIRQRVFNELIPNLENVFDDLVFNYPDSVYPSEYMDGFENVLHGLQYEFGDDDHIQLITDNLLIRVNEWVDEKTREDEEQKNQTTFRQPEKHEHSHPTTERSIFDDVDQIEE